MTVLDLFRLEDRVAVVTGASSGLGVTFARARAEAGSDVILAARRVDGLQETLALVEAVDGRARVVGTSVASPEQCQTFVDSAVAEHGHVDNLVNNAGVGTAVPAKLEAP